jgi:hypothetical protein
MLNIGKEVAALERLTVGELRERYAELFSETTQARNRTWLIRRIIWRMQSLEGGGLSERARQRADELASTSDLRVTAPRKPKLSPDAPERTTTTVCRIEGGSRLPLPGTLVMRQYKGRLIQVKVVANGFEFEGDLYKSLSAVAKKVTGSHWNGFKFFKLEKEGGAA